MLSYMPMCFLMTLFRVVIRLKQLLHLGAVVAVLGHLWGFQGQNMTVKKRCVIVSFHFDPMTDTKTGFEVILHWRNGIEPDHPLPLVQKNMLLESTNLTDYKTHEQRRYCFWRDNKIKSRQSCSQLCEAVLSTALS